MFKIKRWMRMLTGKSIDHVNQDKGKCFSTEGIEGYYNNLTEKVTKNPSVFSSDALPILCLENGEEVVFPVAVFQYGLGAYDLYLMSGDERYLRKFKQCVDWAAGNLDERGRWNNFFFYSPDTPYSAMAQGEGASLLLRAYVHNRDERYLSAAKMAIDYMLTPIEDGGTTKYDGESALLMEYTFKGMVMNGAIFAWWGLYDYVKATGDEGKYLKAMNRTLDSLINIMSRFKCEYWSMYSLDGLIASPFYHNLHVAQMEAMYEVTGEKVFADYAILWRKQQHNPLCKSIAFIRKVAQKILEK